ncbi:hypothetical protein ElyMa_002068700 [Elysia marginata]|uniref:Uncharacterized protein n=1 Tax=Elysia marginata TaxID=1093978 RepID=A0AAV4FBL6_9GAST|nr:hypothetical protein ElyMa_002068700 [Elysia marginata]
MYYIMDKRQKVDWGQKGRLIKERAEKKMDIREKKFQVGPKIEGSESLSIVLFRAYTQVVGKKKKDYYDKDDVDDEDDDNEKDDVLIYEEDDNNDNYDDS